MNAKNAKSKKAGKITVVSTPIGNLGDISRRALDTLENADLVAAEDTRHSGTLLHHYGIKKPMISCHKHNERSQEAAIFRALNEGKDVALVCDAGTPCISDPGWALIRQAMDEDYTVDAVPGPCAAIQALVLSGLNTERFAFEGFLPRGSQLPPYLEELKTETRTMVIYESPHRVKETLAALCQAFGGTRKAAVCRELTKLFQEVNRGTLEDICRNWQERNAQGEFVLVVEGADREQLTPQADMEQIKSHMARLMAGGMKHKAAAKEIALIYDLPVGQAYDLGLEIKE